MTKRLPLTIVSPEKVTWEGEVDSLVLPAFEGQLGILPGHAPLLAQLVPGIIQIRRGEEMRYLSVSGGFVEVYGGHVSLFAETAELAEEIDAERAKLAMERARAAIQMPAKGGPELDQARAALQRALVRLNVAQKASRLRGAVKGANR